jgi:hypothetical protein
MKMSMMIMYNHVEIEEVNHSENFFGKPDKDIIALYLENGTELLIH